MDKAVKDKIEEYFKADEIVQITNALLSITTEHTWDSEYNLKNTRLSILKLAKGNINEVLELTNCTKTDFRDVVIWATQE